MTRSVAMLPPEGRFGSTRLREGQREEALRLNGDDLGSFQEMGCSELTSLGLDLDQKLLLNVVCILQRDKDTINTS